MSEKKELTRAELVRLRREKENAKRMERAVKEATRPVPAGHDARQTGRCCSRSANLDVPAMRAVASRSRYCLSRQMQICAASAFPSAPGDAFAFILRCCAAWRCALFCVQPASIARGAGADHWQPDVISGRNQFCVECRRTTGLSAHPFGAGNTAPPQLSRACFRQSGCDLAQCCFRECHGATSRSSAGSRAGGYTWISEDGVAFRPRGEIAGLISVVAVSAPPTEGNVSPDPLTPAPFISAEMVQAIEGTGGSRPARHDDFV